MRQAASTPNTRRGCPAIKWSGTGLSRYPAHIPRVAAVPLPPLPFSSSLLRSQARGELASLVPGRFEGRVGSSCRIVPPCRVFAGVVPVFAPSIRTSADMTGICDKVMWGTGTFDYQNHACTYNLHACAVLPLFPDPEEARMRGHRSLIKSLIHRGGPDA